jgi:hypothetical protein
VAVRVGGDLHESDGGRSAMAKARPKERKTKGRWSPASPLMGKKQWWWNLPVDEMEEKGEGGLRFLYTMRRQGGD